MSFQVDIIEEVPLTPLPRLVYVIPQGWFSRSVLLRLCPILASEILSTSGVFIDPQRIWIQNCRFLVMEVSLASDVVFLQQHSPYEVTLDGETHFCTFDNERPFYLLDPSIIDMDTTRGGVLGRGGFGVVRSGTLRVGATLLPVAIKKSLVSTREEMLQIEKEVRMMAKVAHHPHTIRYYGCWMGTGREGDTFYIAIERCEGGTMLSWLREQRRANRLTDQKKLTILLQLAQGMQHLHSLSIVHCDLKPENVLLLSEASSTNPIMVKIVDFGFSRNLSSISTTNLRGTADYMPDPKTRIVSGELAKAIDVYAFGILAWECWAVQKAYDLIRRRGVDDLQLLELVHGPQQVRPDMSLVATSMPQSLQDLCCLCWAPSNVGLAEKPSFQEIVRELAVLVEGN